MRDAQGAMPDRENQIINDIWPPRTKVYSIYYLGNQITICMYASHWIGQRGKDNILKKPLILKSSTFYYGYLYDYH